MKKNDSIQTEKFVYKLIKQIGEGGNSYVWKAKIVNKNKDVEDNRIVAIKCLKYKENKSTKISRFKQEIKFCIKNNHDNIISIIDQGEVEDVFFYVMPIYETTLRTIVNNRQAYLLKQKFDYIIKICEGIKFIHDKNIIHRDLKPENILINQESIVLCDFGIAHFEDSILTVEEDLLANRAYASPEQKGVGKAKEITSATDIFSLACIINELVTGCNPAGKNFVKIGDVVPFLYPLDDLIGQCLDYNPNKRPSIDILLLKIKLFLGKINSDMQEIVSLNTIGKTTLSEKEKDIINQSGEDILTAKQFFENKSNEFLEKLNFNYHCNIHYQIDEYLKKIYFQKTLLDICIKKFEYESHVYTDGKPYISLDLNKEEDLERYNRLKQVLSRYKLKNLAWKGIEGSINKHFLSCCDYHCDEILDKIKTIENEISELEDAPILYIVMKFRDNAISNLFEAKEAQLDHHVFVNWDKTLNGFSYPQENMYYKEPMEKLLAILEEFKLKWGIIFQQVGINEFTIMFQAKSSYDDFVKFSIDTAKGYYIFEGDVLDILRVENEYDGIVQVKNFNTFDITNTLAKILKIRKINE
ncbi:MAG: serine/threonine-protein kinase [Bacillota bacterium]